LYLQLFIIMLCLLFALHTYRHASANEETSVKLRELLMSWMQEVRGDVYLKTLGYNKS